MIPYDPKILTLMAFDPPRPGFGTQKQAKANTVHVEGP